MTIKILGVGSSMRNSSYGTRALKMILGAARKHEAKTRLLDLRGTIMPIFNPDRPNEHHEQLNRVTDDVNWADAFALASPDYHGSMSGVMKNFLDFYWEEFAGKTFGYICSSHEKGLTVMEQMRTAVRQCYGWSMPYGVSINGPQDFTNRELVNSRLSSRLRMMARDLVVYGRLVRDQFVRDLGSSEPDTFAAHYRP